MTPIPPCPSPPPLDACLEAIAIAGTPTSALACGPHASAVSEATTAAATTTTTTATTSKRRKALSHKLSTLLRHKIVRSSDPLFPHLRTDGFIDLSLVLPRISASCEEVKEVVSHDEKTRYSVVQEGGMLLIRANQGHSKNSKIDQTKLLCPVDTTSEKVFFCHGTNKNALKAILSSGKLSRCTRTHVHLSRSATDKSTMRKTADIVIWVDGSRASGEGGLEFFESENGVVLCQGPIDKQFFDRIEDRKGKPIEETI